MLPKDIMFPNKKINLRKVFKIKKIKIKREGNFENILTLSLKIRQYVEEDLFKFLQKQ